MGEPFMSYHPDPLIRDYQDRGMVKWLGFYLSEHTAEMNAEKNARDLRQQRNPQMSELEIADILHRSYLTKSVVEIQLAVLTAEGQPIADVIGVVCGFDDTLIFLMNDRMEIQAVSNESIHHVHLVRTIKWSEFS